MGPTTTTTTTSAPPDPVNASAGVVQLASPYNCTSNCVYEKEVVLLVNPGDTYRFTAPIFQHGLVFASSVA